MVRRDSRAPIATRPSSPSLPQRKLPIDMNAYRTRYPTRPVAAIAALLLLGAVPHLSVADEHAATALQTRVLPAVASVETFADKVSEPLVTGSGFFVDPRGLMVTNYHVVSDFARKQAGQHLEVRNAKGERLKAQLLAFDLVDDLALLKLDAPGAAPGVVRLAPHPQALARGSAIHAFGNALALGIASTHGYFSGRMDQVGFERLHFTGTLNPGMSGGPAVNERGELVGVNVSRRRDAEQMSFLVPASRVQALLDRPRPVQALSQADVSRETGRQLKAFQGRLRDEATGAPWTSQKLGPYLAPAFLQRRLNCLPISPDTNDEQAATSEIRGVACQLMAGVYIEDGNVGGNLSYSHQHVDGQRMNAVRFNNLVDSMHRSLNESPSNKVMALTRCVDQRTLAGTAQGTPVRLLWCAQAYREFDDLYDVNVNVVTRNSGTQALVSKLQLVGVSWDTAALYTQRFLQGIQ